MENINNCLNDFPVELFRPIQPPLDKVKSKSHEMEKNSNTILDNFGFKIILGIPNNCEAPSYRHKMKYKYLKSWYLRFSSCDKFRIICVSGKLCVPNNTIVEVDHDAGVLQKRVKKDLIVTSKGTYRLIGPPAISEKQSINKNYYNFYTCFNIIGGLPIDYKELIFK